MSMLDHQPYTYSNLLTERQAAIEAEYKHDIKMACWCFPLAVIVAWVILAF